MIFISARVIKWNRFSEFDTFFDKLSKRKKRVQTFRNV